MVFMAQLALSSRDAARAEPRNKKFVPLPQVVPVRDDRTTTPETVSLGKQLFFDPRLSGDNAMSCASCHLPEKAWTDGLPQGKGNGGRELRRNTPTLLNVGFLSRLFWDGRAANLEEQALVPIQSCDEMNQNLDELEQELNAVPGYAAQFKTVFGSEATQAGIAQALAAFQRSLITEPAPFDRYLAGEKDALSYSAQRGFELFKGEADCARCHHGPLLSDERFYRLGASFGDAGLAAVSGNHDDKGKFRTPSLRNIAQTGPYMHDGSLATLTDVVTFYYRGVPTSTPDELPLDVQPLYGQSFSEISDLVSFLETLSGKAPEITPPDLP